MKAYNVGTTQEIGAAVKRIAEVKAAKAQAENEVNEMAQQFSRNEISEWTNFDAGEEFTSEEQVRDYFTVATMESIGLGGYPDGERQLTQDDLDDMADTVIENRWHCAF